MTLQCVVTKRVVDDGVCLRNHFSLSWTLTRLHCAAPANTEEPQIARALEDKSTSAWECAFYELKIASNLTSPQLFHSWLIVWVHFEHLRALSYGAGWKIDKTTIVRVIPGWLAGCITIETTFVTSGHALSLTATVRRFQLAFWRFWTKATPTADAIHREVKLKF